MILRSYLDDNELFWWYQEYDILSEYDFGNDI